jgi:hypothetical protein
MTAPTTSEYITEPLGFKAILLGFGGNIVATLAQIDWMTILTVLLMIGGAAIQFLAYMRGRRAERRDNEKHALEIALLKKQLEGKDKS